MSQMARPSRRISAGPNVYTALAFISIVILGVGIGYLWFKNTQMTGESNPLHRVPAPTAAS